MLGDLDELVLKCRDQGARRHIFEAVSSYRSGAYRASIVMTGVAVSYDIIQKIRELALAGDPEAERQVQKFNEIRERNDVKQSLDFERSLPELAKDKFELISPLEYADLIRLVEDRNRCAHPSFISDGEMFQPSAELARLHLRSAVENLLAHEPAQGKYALEMIMKGVASEYFPKDPEKILEALQAGPLRRARASLIRNFLVLVVKEKLADGLAYEKEKVYAACCSAVTKMHPSSWADFVRDDVPKLVRSSFAGGSEWPAVRLVYEVAGIFAEMPADVQETIRNYVRKLPKDFGMYVDEIWAGCASLHEAVTARVNRMSAEELMENEDYWLHVPEVWTKAIIRNYCAVLQPNDMSLWAKVIVKFAPHFTATNAAAFVAGIARNPLIKADEGVGATINAVRHRGMLEAEIWSGLLNEAGLAQFDA